MDKMLGDILREAVAVAKRSSDPLEGLEWADKADQFTAELCHELYPESSATSSSQCQEGSDPQPLGLNLTIRDRAVSEGQVVTAH